MTGLADRRAAAGRALARRDWDDARACYGAHHPERASSIDAVLAHLDPLEAARLALRPRVRFEHDGFSCTVENDIFFIGRGIERVHLYIPSPMLSRVHARIFWETPPGRWIFEDCSSENGSFHAGERVNRRPVEDGDAFALGDASIVLRFRMKRPAAQLDV